MKPARGEFGRRGRPVQTSLPQGLPDAKPPTPVRKRSVAVALLAAGALSASAMHFLERGTPATACEPVDGKAAGIATPAADTATGGFGGETPCPPGTRRSSTAHSSSSRSRIGLFSGWHWSSSSSSSSTSHLGTRTSSSHVSPASVKRGGFGSTGSFHFSGGS